MKSLCLTCKKMETKDSQGDDICKACSPQKFKCKGYVQIGREDYMPVETNFSRITRSPESLAPHLIFYVDNKGWYVFLGDAYSPFKTSQDAIEYVINWLNQEAAKEKKS